jgi:predicted transcriptional regulator
MSTTSIKLSDELKRRTALVAQQQGLSAHAFMVQSIKQATDAAEQRSRFIAEAQTALAETRTSGKGYQAEEVYAYLRQRIAGEKTAAPGAVSWRE